MGANEPWWVETVRKLLEPSGRPSSDLKSLWSHARCIAFVTDNVDVGLLGTDFEGHSERAALWESFFLHRDSVADALDQARQRTMARLQGAGEDVFRAEWTEGGDDFLDGLLDIAHLTVGEERPAFGQVNQASKANRIFDFLERFRPTGADVVYDLGSGNGKFAITVAASSKARVCGVELGASYVAAANRIGKRLGLGHVSFLQADARTVDFSDGNLFYLFHPFWGDVAREVSQRLATLAQKKRISIYVGGPQYGFAEHFQSQVAVGALRVLEQRGASGDVLLLRSP